MTGNTALITGGAKRLGRAIAKALGEDGYRIAVHHNGSGDEAEALAAQIEADGGAAFTVKADLAVTGETENLIEKASAHGPVTCLVNNASSFEYDTGHDFSAGTWDRQLAVNLRAPALLSRDFASHLPASLTGCIVNLLDQDVAAPSPEFFSYTVSKAALQTVTRLTAMAFAPRIRVCAVAPGLTLPSGRQSKAQFDDAQAALPLGRGATPQAIAEAVRYLVNAGRVTGQILFVDGGEHLQAPRDSGDIIEDG